MDHHPQVFEDVIDICDVSLSRATQAEVVHVKVVTHRAVLISGHAGLDI